MKILSFIIPAYNSEKFLEKCILSMLHLDILEQLEIVIVDDGSTDRTSTIAKKCCSQYPGVIRLISQENKGHGGALNTGCAAAQGKYLKVIDSDDWVETENLPEFIYFLERCDSDVVLTHYRTHDISNGEIKSWTCIPDAFGNAYNLDHIMANWRSFYHLLTFHGITYRTAFYRQFSISLSEHVFYEDYEFATFPCCFANSVMPVNLFVYDYRIGDVNQSVSDASKLKRVSHLETVLQRMRKECLSADMDAGGRQYVNMKIQELLLSYLKVVLLIEPDKRTGRKMAENMMYIFRQKVPGVAALAEKKYRCFLVMNRLHISNQMWEDILRSRLYHILRGN